MPESAKCEEDWLCIGRVAPDLFSNMLVGTSPLAGTNLATSTQISDNIFAVEQDASSSHDESMMEENARLKAMLEVRNVQMSVLERQLRQDAPTDGVASLSLSTGSPEDALVGTEHLHSVCPRPKAASRTRSTSSRPRNSTGGQTTEVVGSTTMGDPPSATLPIDCVSAVSSKEQGGAAVTHKIDATCAMPHCHQSVQVTSTTKTQPRRQIPVAVEALQGQIGIGGQRAQNVISVMLVQQRLHPAQQHVACTHLSTGPLNWQSAQAANVEARSMPGTLAGLGPSSRDQYFMPSVHLQGAHNGQHKVLTCSPNVAAGAQ